MIQQLAPHSIWEQWNVEPFILIPLSIALVLYSFSTARAALVARDAVSVELRKWLAFLGGCGALAIALVSPIQALAPQLLSAHMAQHVLLMLIAPPLFVLSSAPHVLASLVPYSAKQLFISLRQRSRTLRQAWELVDRSIVLWLMCVAVLWLWHVPLLYDLALQNEQLHMVEHLTFLGAGLVFWQRVLQRALVQKRLAAFGAGIVYAIAMGLQSGVLGGLLAFTAVPWYAAYTVSNRWGINPLWDQQLAGLILWIPAGLVYVATAAVLFVMWMNAVERELRKREKEAQTEDDSPPTLNRSRILGRNER